MSQRQSYLTPIVWFLSSMWSVAFAFGLTLVTVATVLRALAPTSSGVALVFTSAVIGAIGVGLGAGAVAEKVNAPDWAVIPAAMGLVWSRGPSLLASVLGLTPGTSWAWIVVAVVVVLFGLAAELARLLIRNRRSAQPVRSPFGLHELRRRKGLATGLAIALAVVGFYLWFSPDLIVGIPPLSPGQHAAIDFNSLPLEQQNGMLISTVAPYDAAFGRFLRYSVRTDASTVFVFDGKQTNLEGFLRRYRKNGVLDSLQVGQGGLIIRAEASSIDFDWD